MAFSKSSMGDRGSGGASLPRALSRQQRRRGDPVGDRHAHDVVDPVIKLAAAVAVFALGGCINMSTPPAEIAAAPVSAQKYENHTCAQLIDELGTIAKRERTLVEAQDRR